MPRAWENHPRYLAVERVDFSKNIHFYGQPLVGGCFFFIYKYNIFDKRIQDFILLCVFPDVFFAEKSCRKKLKKLLTFLRGCSIVFIVPVRTTNGTPKNATVAQLVEYDLAKVGVAGSNPVCRSERSTWYLRRDAGAFSYVRYSILQYLLTRCIKNTGCWR